VNHLILLLALMQQPAAQQCPKYQHWIEPSQFCGDSVYYDEKSGKLVSMCFQPHCADDMHQVTEKEWQEIQSRLAAMDKYIKESVCKNLGYIDQQLTTDGGKTSVNCSDMRPK